MDIPTLSLIVAALAVFVGPIISLSIAKRQIRASANLASAQIQSSMETANKQIVAPMRQAWINSLRDMLAELLGSVLHYYAAGYDDRSEDEYRRVTFLESRIQLMLNQGEEDHKNLEKLIRKMVATLASEDQDSFPDLYEQVRALSRQILKREWDRVKEPLAVLPVRDLE